MEEDSRENQAQVKKRLVREKMESYQVSLKVERFYDFGIHSLQFLHKKKNEHNYINTSRTSRANMTFAEIIHL